MVSAQFYLCYVLLHVTHVTIPRIMFNFSLICTVASEVAYRTILDIVMAALTSGPAEPTAAPEAAPWKHVQCTVYVCKT